ncbi:MAG: site-specific DNA-methyltransferase [Ruminococcaceae bacterium]|nr:site-specific DNA-methyltransferase [Oscillospiraceae bacterium]
MANLSQIKRQRLIDFLNKIREEHREDDTALIAINEIESELNDKKYGLVWEEHQEQVDVEMLTKVPVFSEQADKEITADETLPYNFLLEGDNLHSLKLLEKTHKGKIDVIYIDPPYNTGNKDFTYNDIIVGSEDTFKHSKWLSFIEKRLSIAQSLLSMNGVIFISIDDNEYANLKLLCDSVFGEQNFIANICRQAIKGGSRAHNIKSVHDYVLIYAKNISSLTEFTGFEKEEMSLPLQDEKGMYAKGRELNKWGAGSRREDSPTMYFAIKGPNGEEVYPIRNDGSDGRWRWGKKKMLEAVENNDVIFEKRDNGTYIVYEKVRGNKSTTTQFTTWFADSYINAKGSESLKKIFNTMMSVFDYAKPVELVQHLIFMSNHKNCTVLDFFAGSGTTAQAVMELNAEDNGDRKFILCTNNENGICEDITYQRIKTVITGKRKDGSDYSDGISANLKYYKTDFIDKTSEDEEYSVGEELLKHIAEMVQLEYAVRLDGKNYVLLLSDEEADTFIADDEKLSACSAVYVSTAVLLTAEQEKKLSELGIAIFVIPDYYFENELLEVGER